MCKSTTALTFVICCDNFKVALELVTCNIDNIVTTMTDTCCNMNMRLKILKLGFRLQKERHLKIHSGEKSNNCSQCDYAICILSGGQVEDTFENTQWRKSQTNKGTNVTF